jgi:cysteinyl-tRNA synthetase
MYLTLHDTLTRAKRRFEPLDPARVRMYVCGPTVYDFAHIGNARPVIVFDVLFRLLNYIYGPDHVVYVRNITDVDDKINARAAEEYPDIPLNEAISEMRTLIEQLLVEGNAYVAQDHVLFAVASMPDYGMLSKRSLDEMMAGARVDVAPYKRNPMDFVLWKPSKPGEPSWPSPAGVAVPGRPGWHIECSAMAWKHLGKTFDIHGGGVDLVFPHHENEIAQSRSAFHTPLMATIWMHNGFLQVEGDKMSKSLGNFVTIRDLLKEWPGDVLRFQMLMTHYRQPIDWTKSATEQAVAALDTFQHVTKTAESRDGRLSSPVLEALADDLNTPLAIAELHRLAGEGRKGDFHAACDLKSTCRFLGFDLAGVSFQDLLKQRRPDLDEAKIQALIDARTQARASKNFAESDRIRGELAAMGVVLKDSKDGTSWEIAP